MVGPYGAWPVYQGKGTNLCWASCLLFMQNAHQYGMGPGGTGTKKWTLDEMVKHYAAYQRKNDFLVNEKHIGPDGITAESMVSLMKSSDWNLTTKVLDASYLNERVIGEWSTYGWFILGYKPAKVSVGHYNCVALDTDRSICVMEPWHGKLMTKTVEQYSTGGWGKLIVGYVA